MLRRLTDTFHVEEPSDDEINDLLKELNVNGDGRVSQAEFESLIEEVISLIE
jgi:Ca2+-binding EF-hand superfamily protein